MIGAVYGRTMPRVLRLAGARFRDGRGSYRMSWGELSIRAHGFALELCLFGDRPHFSLQLKAFWVSLFIKLPFLNRFAYEPKEIMESWGISYNESIFWLRWGSKYKLVTMPWADWKHMSHDVLSVDGSWVPFVGSWEQEKEPDGRVTETHPYRYLTTSGEKQEVTATLHVERRIWRLRWLAWTHAFQKVRRSIDIAFSDEVGERRGSWKGGTIGCGYDLEPDETPLQCLRRMEQERRFT